MGFEKWRSRFQPVHPSGLHRIPGNYAEVLAETAGSVGLSAGSGYSVLYACDAFSKISSHTGILMQVRQISDEEVTRVLSQGEFSPDVLGAADRVCVIMTQDWCLEWKRMQRWLHELPDEAGVAVFELVYNRISMFEQFLSLKETRWNNALIPYVRFYRGGQLRDESNYVGREEFLSRLRA